jgi:hypothetical protein
LTVHRTFTQESTFSKLVGVKSYYERLISLIDPEFWQEKREKNNQFEDTGLNYYSSDKTKKLSTNATDKYNISVNESNGSNHRSISFSLISAILLLVYVSGLIFFFLRFLYLFRHMAAFIIKYRITKFENIKIVPVNEDISPFSFFGFVFINRRALPENEFANIIAHEQVHIRQHHTADLLLAHIASIFQWFNPFAWLTKDALKMTHEYIADRAIVEQGFELFDYQSLLLKQLISSRTFELANNFNLKPIKNRIAMLTKSKSRKLACLKALLVSPIALVLILLFSEMTIKEPDGVTLNLKEIIAGNLKLPELTGIWKNVNNSAYGSMILIEINRISILEGYAQVKSFPMQITGKQMILSPEASLNYRLGSQDLTIWWNEKELSTYTKTDCKNSMDCFIAGRGLKMDLPVITQQRTIDNPDLVYSFFITQSPASEGGYRTLYNGTEIKPSEVGGIVEKERRLRKNFDVSGLAVELFVDKNVPMGEVDKVKNELRKSDALKIIFAATPESKEITPLLYHAQGMFFKLPPLDAKELSNEELKKQNIPLFHLNLTEKNLNPSSVHENVEKFITGSDKEIVVLQYGNSTPYGEYLETKDLLFRVYAELRNKMSLERYSIPYEELGSKQQKEIQKVYPVIITENNLDN